MSMRLSGLHMLSGGYVGGVNGNTVEMKCLSD